MKSKSPPQCTDVLKKINECLETGKYYDTTHSSQRRNERRITLPDMKYVLKYGWHERSKTRFDPMYNKWKYAIHGTTLDGDDLRVIVCFDNEAMIIITVIRIERKN